MTECTYWEWECVCVCVCSGCDGEDVFHGSGLDIWADSDTINNMSKSWFGNNNKLSFVRAGVSGGNLKWIVVWGQEERPGLDM